jgi:hypothetical protein
MLGIAGDLPIERLVRLLDLKSWREISVASDHFARSFAGRVLQDAHLYHLSGDGGI